MSLKPDMSDIDGRVEKMNFSRVVWDETTEEVHFDKGLPGIVPDRKKFEYLTKFPQTPVKMNLLFVSPNNAHRSKYSFSKLLSTM